MTRTAVVSMTAAGEPDFDIECMKLIFGLSDNEVDRYSRPGGRWKLPKSVVRRGHLRRVAYLARTRTVALQRTSVVDLLMHYARREDVELIYDDCGHRTVLVAAGGDADN